MALFIDFLFLVLGSWFENYAFYGFISCAFSSVSKQGSSVQPSQGVSANQKGGTASSPQDHTLCVSEIQERIGPSCMVNYCSEQPDSRVYLTPHRERDNKRERESVR